MIPPRLCDSAVVFGQNAVDVTVIVVNLDGKDILPACLASIPEGTETIVVDNGSQDGSADAAAAQRPGATIIRNDVNRGFATAVNQGIDQAHGRYYCLLNSDARLQPGALETLVKFMDAQPDVGIATPQLIYEDGRLQNSFDNIPSLASELLNKGLLRALFPGAYPSKRQKQDWPFEVPSVIGACMMIRREVVDLVGPLDPEYFVFLEETDFCLRSRRAGYRTVVVPAARAVHLQGKTRNRMAVRARIEYVRSLFAFFRKHRTASYPLLRLLYPVKNAVELAFGTPGLPFSVRARRRWLETAGVLAWQLALAPRKWGLSSVADFKFQNWHDAVIAEEWSKQLRDYADWLPGGRKVKDLKYKYTLECRIRGRIFLVKIYRTGSLFRTIKTWLRGSRAEHEWRTCLTLLRRGVPTVPIAAIMHVEGKGEGQVVVEILQGWRQLQEVLLSDAVPSGERRALAFEYGKFARRLHDAGIWQDDFNPSNILVSGRKFKVIDFERMRVVWRIPERERMRLLGKMNRIPKLSRTDRLRFLKGYVAAYPEERRRIKEIAARLERQIGRQEEIDDERAGRRCVRENRDFAAFQIGEWQGYYRRRRSENQTGVGLAYSELRALVADPASYLLEPHDDALEQWKQANREAHRGGPVPLAVLTREGESRGTIAYRKVEKKT